MPPPSDRLVRCVGPLGMGAISTLASAQDAGTIADNDQTRDTAGTLSKPSSIDPSSLANRLAGAKLGQAREAEYALALDVVGYFGLTEQYPTELQVHAFKRS